MPSVLRIPVDTFAELIDVPETVHIQEARIIDDFVEILVSGSWRGADGGVRKLEDRVWYAAVYYPVTADVPVLGLQDFKRLADDG